MKTILLAVAAATFVVPACASAERLQDAQRIMEIDLQACMRPDYPAAALAEGAEGKTTVEFQIGGQGRVLEARVVASSGRADLDDAALAGIRGCTFRTVVAAGAAPSGWLRTQYLWLAHGSNGAALLDPEQLDSTKARAASGDAVAQNQLGVWYERGIYFKADPAQAAHWYRLAAHGGYAVAQNNLGVLYNRGAGVPLDRKMAVHWYAKAAEQGHGWAQANLAWAYQYGSIGEPDFDKARYWLTRSAEGGLADAQARLGRFLMTRATSDDERVAASAWLEKAAAQNYPQGLYYLGRSFELGLGNVQDDERAAALYRAVLGRSEGRGETALAMLLDAGRGGRASEEEVARLYRTAMASRYPAAFYQYGLLLERQGDDAMASSFFLSAAELGDCQGAIRSLQLRQAAGTDSTAASSKVNLAGRAAFCAHLADLPPQL